MLRLIGTGKFDISISVPLILEYEEVAKRLAGSKIALSPQEIDAIIDYLCAVGQHHHIYYLWRPTLSDPDDDMLLELAVSAHCSFIVTYNLRDFLGIEPFGLQAITPKMFLDKIGAIS